MCDRGICGRCLLMCCCFYIQVNFKRSSTKQHIDIVLKQWLTKATLVNISNVYEICLNMPMLYYLLKYRLNLYIFPQHTSKRWEKPHFKFRFNFVDVLDLKVLQLGFYLFLCRSQKILSTEKKQTTPCKNLLNLYRNTTGKLGECKCCWSWLYLCAPCSYPCKVAWMGGEFLPKTES